MITSLDKLSKIRGTLGTIVYARGAFDILHSGHVDFINKAKSEGDTLVLGIISDTVVRKNKGKGRPVNSQHDRLFVADALKGVGYVFTVPEPNQTHTSTELVLAALKPQVFVLYDEVPEYTAHFKELMDHYNIKLVLDGSEKRSSTTEIIEKLKKAVI